MAGTENPNGSAGTYNVKAGASQFIKAPNSGTTAMKPQVVKGGDLRAKGSK